MSEEEEVRASHILIKNVNSRNPKSHRQAKITRSENEAREILQKLRGINQKNQNPHSSYKFSLI